MSWIKKGNVAAYFGNLENNLYNNNHYDEKRFLDIIKKIHREVNATVDCAYFPKQIHTADVVTINHEMHLKKPIHLFHEQADSVITNEKNTAIGVVTADCLPLFLYDTENQAIGVIHAGWRGLSAKIITATILKMRDQFSTSPQHLQAYLGPSAGVCCYEVQVEFLSYFSESLIEQREGKLFFNPKNAGISELLTNGLSINNIDTTNHACTICSDHFCSVRRQKKNAGRQPSFIFLH